MAGMPDTEPSPTGTASAAEEGAIELTSSELFTIVWDTLEEVLGTAAVAAIVRRAGGRAAQGTPRASPST
jgi:hypothetical protein